MAPAVSRDEVSPLAARFGGMKADVKRLKELGAPEFSIPAASASGPALYGSSKLSAS